MYEVTFELVLFFLIIPWLTRKSPTWTIIGTGIAIIIAVIVAVAIVGILLLRKK